uniref:Type II restriction enzyme NaeI domain-containing protein n=1 Tax=Streptomyces sp. NBC_00008 TaxID=2903610 RepID=A0AAU2VMH1_9ACTN
MDALVMLLRDVRRQARLSVEDVHELLKSSGQFEGRLPARSTLYRKLNGIGLKNERRLVEAIVRICVPDERRADALREQAIALLHQAWSKDAEPVPPRLTTASNDSNTLAELVSVQRKLIDIQVQLAAALQTAAEAEKEAARSRALVTMLLGLRSVRTTAAGSPLAPAPGTPAGVDSGTDPSVLRAGLAAAEVERDEIRQAARAARQRLAEEPRATHAGSTGPHSVRPREWPTTRTDFVDHATLADTRARGTGLAVPYTTVPPGERGEQHGAMSLSERPASDPVRAVEDDPELAEVLAEMLRLDRDGSRMGSVIDGAGRHLLDPAHTGRYLWSQLTKAEKTVFGTAVCQRMQRELGLADGLHLDFMVAGHEVEMKFTLGSNWMFPPELQDGLSLVVSADDANGLWSLGLLRVRPELMRTGANRDGKRGLSARGRQAIHWIYRHLQLPEHALRRLPADTVGAIFAKRTAQARTEELFLRAQLTAITTADLSAVTMQTDGIKRAREARRRLTDQGVLILNGMHPRDAEWASGLGLPAPGANTWMSIRLAPAPPQDDGRPTITLDGNPWCVAGPGDPESPLPVSGLF